MAKKNLTVDTLDLAGRITRAPFPGSAKIYIQGARPDVRVPFREVTLTDTLVAEGFVTDQSSKAFESSYQEFNDGINKTVAGLEGLSGFLTKAASTFRDSDSGLAQGLKG